MNEFMVCELGAWNQLSTQAQVLDAYGKNGWSLVAVREDDGTVIGYLQRPLATDSTGGES